MESLRTTSQPGLVWPTSSSQDLELLQMLQEQSSLYAGPASLVPYLAYGAGCDGSSTTAGGRGGGGGFAAGAGGEGEGANVVGEVDEKRAAQPADWKPKRGRPKKQEAGDASAGSAQCPEGAKRALFEAAAAAACGQASLAGAP